MKQKPAVHIDGQMEFEGFIRVLYGFIEHGQEIRGTFLIAKMLPNVLPDRCD